MKRLLTLLFCFVTCAIAFGQGRLIVRLKPGVSGSEIARRHQVIFLDATQNAPFALLQLPVGSNDQAIIAAMTLDPSIAWVEDDDGLSAPEGQQKGSTLPAVGDRRLVHAVNSKAFNMVRWTSALGLAPGRKVRIAVLDNGLSRKYPYLWKKVVASANYVTPGQTAYDYPMLVDTNKDGVRDAMVGHGTMVTGLVDALSPKSNLIVVKVADSDGIATLWSVIKGLAFAVTKGADVANISLGTQLRLPAMTDILDWCEENRLVVVASVGNDGQGVATYPAGISKVVAVAGINPDFTRASFSNWDSSCDLSAPATGIASQDWNGSIGVWSGTSFAAPMGAALCAEMARRCTTRPTPEHIRDELKRLGEPMTIWNGDLGRKMGVRVNFSRILTYFRPM